MIGLETSDEILSRYGDILHILDKIIIYAFALEALLKIMQFGRRFYKYFENPWNIFDFVIVVVCFLPGDYHFTALLRMARVLRALRLITAVPRLQLLVRAEKYSFHDLCKSASRTSVLCLCGTWCVFLWADNDPSHFRDLPTAIISLFQDNHSGGLD